MKTRTTVAAVLAFGVVLFLAGAARAVSIETVPVGNTGNADDTHGDGYGAVGYAYNIGKYEVTAGQYTEFLNAVADTDTYELYNPFMDMTAYACQITRSGSSGSYNYSVAADWANRPVNFVGWGDVARFANWLHNGQPTGTQDLTTTEDGAYYLNGATTTAQLLAVRRKPGWKWAIPTEDEWYKAAYHKNDGDTSNYFDYPTSSDSAPGYVDDDGDLSGTGNAFVEGGTDPGNYATYDGDLFPRGIGSPYYRAQVGEWENSASPYGTFDQGGNVWEWNEAVIAGGYGMRGGSFSIPDSSLLASYRGFDFLDGGYHAGFRVVAPIPEPMTMLAVGLGITGLGGYIRKRRRC